MVTEDNVVAVLRRRAAAAGKGVDDVEVAAAAEDHVAADAGGDRVVAVAELVAVLLTVPASIDVDAAQHLDLVVVVGLRDPGRAGLPEVHAQDATVVTEDDVLAGAGVDGVAALATEDDVVGPSSVMVSALPKTAAVSTLSTRSSVPRPARPVSMLP